MKLKFLISFIVLFVSFETYSQDTTKTSKKIVYQVNTKVLDTANLQNQFDFMMNRSDSYRGLHAIKDEWLLKYKSHVNDSINKLKTELTIAKQQLSTYQNENNALKSEVSINDDELQKKDSISFIGIPMSKAGFQGLMWSLVGILAAGLAYFAYSYKNSNLITKQAVRRYEELELEINEQRSKSLEREQSLNRQIFDLQKKNTK